MSDTIRATSKAQYDAAQEAWVKALRELQKARKALARAEHAEAVATEELVRHEVKPGIPRYAYGQHVIGDGGL